MTHDDGTDYAIINDKSIAKFSHTPGEYNEKTFNRIAFFAHLMSMSSPKKSFGKS